MHTTVAIMVGLSNLVPNQAADLQRLREATVMVEATSPDSRRTGSGVILSSDGLVATAAHIMVGARTARIRLLSGDFREVVGVVDVDAPHDLALIQVAATGLAAATLGSSVNLRIGQRLVALGCPSGLPVSVVDGL